MRLLELLQLLLQRRIAGVLQLGNGQMRMEMPEFAQRMNAIRDKIASDCV